MKKLLSMMLVGSMCAGAFTACGEENDDKKMEHQLLKKIVSMFQQHYLHPPKHQRLMGKTKMFRHHHLCRLHLQKQQ